MTCFRRRAALALLSVWACQCGKEQPSPARAAPSSTGAAAAPHGAARFLFDTFGEVVFSIDAPLEKIRGRSTKLRGHVDVDPTDLRATEGIVEVDLDDVTTSTFDDPGKNATQTAHVHQWLELGSAVAPNRKEENRWARWTLKSVEPATPDTVSAAPSDGARVVRVDATGDLWLHGVTSVKTLQLDVTFSGPAGAPNEVRVHGVQPLVVSLREHDIKPRDLTGRFLAGALEKVGQKIDDAVQVSIEARARRH